MLADPFLLKCSILGSRKLKVSGADDISLYRTIYRFIYKLIWGDDISIYGVYMLQLI